MVNPAYQVIATNRTPVRNKGECAVFDIYISGDGEIEDCKLHVQYNQPKLIHNDKKPKIDYSEPSIEDPDGDPGIHGFVSSLPLLFFTNQKSIDSEEMLPLRIEVGQGDKPPIQLTLPIGENATPGDYTIPVTFTYKGKGKLKQSRTEINLHINNFREKYNRSFTIAGITVGAAALLRFFGIGLQELGTAVNWLIELLRII